MARCAPVLLAIIIIQIGGGSAVSLYEYFLSGGPPTTGLVAEGSTFKLNGKDITILSGSFHYFRIHPDYWRETFQKMRATGLNTVQTYVPWNLHEPRQAQYDYGDLGEDMSLFLDVRRFIQMAQEEDMFLLFRPGPYICSEWEFGGMPSWLQRDPTMAVRTYYENFRNATKGFFDTLLPLVADLQFMRGGPIIGVQIENEYGNFGFDDEPRDHLYMEFLKDLILSHGYENTLLYTSDSTARTLDWGAVPGVLQTANFKENAEENFAMLRLLQPNRPIMVAEFWTGWYDFWLSGVHMEWSVDAFASNFEYILLQNASVNMYMFIGGTNFGFMSGANSVTFWPHYAPVVTSYDYDAPLSEAGDYTEKYDRVMEILSRLNPLNGIVDNPPQPEQRMKAAYGNISISKAIAFSALMSQSPVILQSVDGPVNMEALPINNMNGQSYGYTLYSTTVTIALPESTLLIRNHVRDMAQVLVDGVLITKPYDTLWNVSSFGFWNGRDQSLQIPGNGGESRLDILVENLGRVNYGTPAQFHQKKGLWEGSVLLDSKEIKDWDIKALEMKKDFITGLVGWANFEGSLSTPSMYYASVTIPDGSAGDTFLDMRAWGKGAVFVNGFNLGRYWSEGPTKTLYIPGPLLLEESDGPNEFVVFEQYDAADNLTFIDYPILN